MFIEARRAFSLLELLVVLFIIGLVGAMSTIATGPFLAGAALDSSAKTLKSVMEEARSLTVTQQRVHRVRLLTAGNGYELEQQAGSGVFTVVRQGQLAKGIVFSAVTFDADTVTFNLRGGFSGVNGSLTLQNRNGKTITLTGYAQTGFFRLQ